MARSQPQNGKYSNEDDAQMAKDELERQARKQREIDETVRQLRAKIALVQFGGRDGHT